MKRGWNAHGYTILEVMIFLAVSSALLVSALLLIGGQQQKTEFSQASRDIQQQVEDIMNNVANGYYSHTANFDCTADSTAGPQITNYGTSTTAIGSNDQCIFVGKAIQFGVGGDKTKFAVYDLVGNRQTNVSGTPQIVTKLEEALPNAPIQFPPDIRTLKYQLSVQRAYYTNSGADTDIGAVALFTTLGELNGSDLVSGTQTFELRPVKTTTITSSTGAVQLAIDIHSPPLAPIPNLDLLPDGGVTVCFKSAGTNQYAKLLIGGNGRVAQTKLTIQDTAC